MTLELFLIVKDEVLLAFRLMESEGTWSSRDVYFFYIYTLWLSLFSVTLCGLTAGEAVWWRLLSLSSSSGVRYYTTTLSCRPPALWSRSTTRHAPLYCALWGGEMASSHLSVLNAALINSSRCKYNTSITHRESSGVWNRDTFCHVVCMYLCVCMCM